jgi:hypothetical protein
MPDVQPVRPAGRQRALVLVRDTRGAAAKWARRGLGPVTVVPGLAWTLVVPAGPARSAPPYDDELALLGGRPVPRSLRPSAVLVADPDRLAIQVQGPSWRAVSRWLVWTRGVGLTRVPDLEAAPPQLVARLLAPTRTSGDRLAAVLARDGRHPAEVADELLEALALPGAGVLSGAVDAAALSGAVRVEPDEHRVARFDAHVGDEERAAREQEGRR